MKNTHEFIREAFYQLCPTYQIIFHSVFYEDIEVVGTEKPSWEAVLAKCLEIELPVFKETIKKQIKEKEEEVRKKTTYDSQAITVSNWSAKRQMALRVIIGTAWDSEIIIFEEEAKIRGLGETVLDLSNKVVSNSDNFLLKNFKIDGYVKSFLLLLEKSNTKEEAVICRDDFFDKIESVIL